MRSACTSMPAIRAVPWVGATKPVKSRMVVVFPAPLGPEERHDLPLGDRERDVPDGQERPELLAEPIGLDHDGRGHTGAILRCFLFLTTAPRAGLRPCCVPPMSVARSWGRPINAGYRRPETPRRAALSISLTKAGRMCSLCADPTADATTLLSVGRGPWSVVGLSSSGPRPWLPFLMSPRSAVRRSPGDMTELA